VTSVASVLRYPVKSMLGVGVAAASLGPSGLVGDRAWALVDDATGKVASAKQPRLWRRLLQVRVEQPAEDGRVVLLLPDGTRLQAGAAGTDAALSRFVGRPVTMRSTREPGAQIDRALPEEVLARGVDAEVDATVLELSQQVPGQGFRDYAPVHLVTTATLDAVGAGTGRAVDARVLRPNLVLSTPDAQGYVEDDWTSRQLTIGEVVLQVFMPAPRCAVPTLQHGEVPAAPEVLRTLGQQHRRPVEGFGLLPVAGVYARVLTGGTVRAGHPVQVGPA
jgi:uncharacterized protein YcbX